ncbi:MAG: RNA-binding protein [Pyrobaculum sp.]
MRRARLSNREVRELREIYNYMSPFLDNAETVEVMKISDNIDIYIIDGEPLFSKFITNEGEYVVPTLYLIHKSQRGGQLKPFPKVYVDQGAVKPIINGADVMRPGIKKFEGDFNKGDIVFVADEKGRVIAVASALYTRGEVEQMQKGKVLINLHYLGDRLWKASLDLVKTKS